MKRKILIPLLAVVLLLSGCTVPNDDYIQGGWVYVDDHLRNLPGESPLTVIWEFSGGTFFYSACCFNQDDAMSGRYRIVKHDENSITIELFNIIGNETRMQPQIKIVIDREADTLNIQGGGPYERINR